MNWESKIGFNFSGNKLSFYPVQDLFVFILNGMNFNFRQKLFIQLCDSEFALVAEETFEILL